MTADIIAQLSFWSLLGASFILAWRFGEKDERFGIAIMVSGAILSSIAVTEFSGRFRSLEAGLLLTDFGVLVALWVLMLKSKRYWPIWASAFQLASLFTHFAVLAAPQKMPASYAVLQGFWAYPIIISLLLGVLGQVRLRAARKSI